jgi:hypothetical protein
MDALLALEQALIFIIGLLIVVFILMSAIRTFVLPRSVCRVIPQAKQMEIGVGACRERLPPQRPFFLADPGRKSPWAGMHQHLSINMP